jgi:hypothetical protein
MGMKARPKDKMITCSCVPADYADNASEHADASCARCKGTGETRQRTNKSKVVWEGSDGQPIRVVLVDADTILTLPCKVVIERGYKNATNLRSWAELNATTNLEKRLGYELAVALGNLPHWAERDDS